MKLIDIPNSQIIQMIMQETLILGSLAFAFGNLFAYLIHDNFPKKVLLLWPDAFMLLGVILSASLLASLVGVYKVVKADPATAIGG